MSLIVDINPVPWEILEQVKARLLKNRAKKQKRQPEKGKELRRVMQVDNGILAKQRWEEPSFIAAGGLHYSIAICDEDDNSSQAINDRDWLAWSDKTEFTFVTDNGEEKTIELSSTAEKRFILLIPKRNDFFGISYYPTQWPTLAGDANTDTVGFSFYVARYDGPENNGIEKPSNYFALIEQATGLPWSQVESVVITVDGSGSMTTASVAPDLDTFRAKLTELGIPFEAFGAGEDWIRPHHASV